MENAKYLLPQPLVALAGQLWAAKGAKNSNREDPTIQIATRVFAYAGMRIALAGALYYAMNKYKTDAIRTSIVGGLVSAPATLMFWGGRLVVDGAKTAFANFRTPLTREFGLGLVTYAGGLLILNFYNYFKFGAVEYLAPKVLLPAEINKRPY